MAALIRAAGAVLWRPGSAGAEVAVVHRPKYGDWSLPKGKLDPGEHPLTAACREVVEETGVTPTAGRRLPAVRYEVPGPDGPEPKVVDYWSMRARAGDDRFEPNREVDEIRWLPPADAAALLTYDHDRPLIDAFTALHPVTGTVLLIRHAKAGSRKAWTGSDGTRPLDSNGQADAVRIARVLPWFDPARIVSAEPARCVQTVEPLAASLGLDIEIDPVFGEEQHADDPKRAAKRLRTLPRGDGDTVVVCSQGAVIPETVAHLAATSGLVLGAVVSRKGSAWALSFRGTALLAADYLPNLGP